jgi:16S rRNA processing protein RimM
LELEDWIEIGTIVGAQGLKGKLRVKPDSDFPERFSQPGQRWLQLNNQSQPQSVELVSGSPIPGKDVYVIQLEGIDNRTQAETLRNAKLLVKKGDRPQLGEDEYHVSDLINLDVFNQLNGEKIGVIINVYQAGNDLLEIKLQNTDNDIEKEESTPDLTKVNRISKLRKITRKKNKKAKTVLIPFVKEIVPVVNLEQGFIEINPPSGLLEIVNC